MANAIYPKAKEAFMSGSIDLTTATIKIALVSNAYSYSSAHQFYSSVSANVLGTPQTMTTKTVTSGVFDADDPSWVAVTSGSTISSYVIYKDTGVAGTSPLIAYFDTATGLPVLTNGGNFNLTFDNGSSKIFAL